MNLQGVVVGLNRTGSGEIVELHYALNQAIIAEATQIEDVEIIIHEACDGQVGHTLLLHTNGCEFVGEVVMSADLARAHDEMLAFAAEGGVVCIQFPKPQTAEQQLRSQRPEMEMHQCTATVYDGHIDHILNAASL